MKILYIFLILALAVIMAVCVFVVHKKDNIYTASIVCMLVMAMVTTISYIAKAVTVDEMRCSVYYAVYYIAIDWMLVGILNYSCIFDRLNGNWDKTKKIRYAIYGITILDTVSVLVSISSEHVYSVSWDIVNETWIINHNLFFTVHLLICYLIVLLIFYQFAKKMFRTEKRYRRKYHLIIMIFVTVVVLNGMFIYFSWNVDYSTVLYPLFAIIVCYYTYIEFPKELTDVSLLSSVEHINCGIVCFDKEGDCIYLNSFAKKLFDISGNDYSKIEEYERKFTNKAINSPVEIFCDIDTFLMDKKEHTFEIKEYKLKDKKDRFIGKYLKFEDMTDELILAERERYRATHDELTGLYNRETFIRKASEIMKKNPDKKRYIVCTNIKDFKLINDLFGEDFGNRILKKQAEMLLKANYKDCIHGRIGGDRFVMLISKGDFNEKLAARNTKVIREQIKDVRYKIHLYIGVYEIENPYESIPSMCDKAFLAIKSIYGDYEHVVAFYDQNHMDRLVFEQEIIGEFENAIKSNQFSVFLQPKFDGEGNIIGAEALSRWKHPTKGLMFPEQYLPIFERTGYIHTLDSYVWETVISRISQWVKRGWTPFPVSFNISAKDFYYINIPKVLKNTAKVYDVNPNLITVEITELALQNDVKAHMEVISELKQYGFGVCIDDFGIGYSSLNLLKDLDVSEVKIDMEFFSKSEELGRSKKIINNVVGMAKKLKMSVIAERVDVEEQYNIVKEFGMDAYQGYYYIKPLCIYDFEKKYIPDSKGCDT